MIRKLQGLRRGSSMWRRCSSFPALKQIHAFMVVNGFNTDLFALRELIFASAIAISGTIDYAHRLFDHISQPDIFIWNTMIRGSSQSSRPFKAIYLFSQMERSCVRPDHFTFPFLLKASTRLSSISLGSEIHGKILKFGFESDDFIRNSLINLHANCGDLNVASAIFRGAPMKDVVAWSSLIAGYARRGEIGTARRMFDEMPDKDLVSWNVMISVYAKCGEMESARKLFDAVLVKDVVSWNAMIAGYVLQGSQVEAMEVFEEMQRAGERPDEVTLLSLLSACADSGALDIGQRIHCSLVESGSNYLSTVLGNALIDIFQCLLEVSALENEMQWKEANVRLNYYNAWGLSSSEERTHFKVEIAIVMQFTSLYAVQLNGMIVRLPIGPQPKKTKKTPPSPNNLGLDTDLD
ncbi:hypothetical protein AAC387_Pa12g2083 [Persea americana]